MARFVLRVGSNFYFTGALLALLCDALLCYVNSLRVVSKFRGALFTRRVLEGVHVEHGGEGSFELSVGSRLATL